MITPPKELGLKTEDSIELFSKAAVLVLREQKASTSFIQRHLQIGYNRAATVIEQLEAAGIVGAASALGTRTVLFKDVEHFEKAVLLVEKCEEVGASIGVEPEKVLDAAKAAAGVGHNSGKKSADFKDRQETTAQDTGGVSGQRLKAFIERVERLEEEKAGIAEDIKDIMAEAKGTGFDTKTMRKVIRLRKMDKQKRNEEEEMLELYKSAIGLE